MMTIRKADLEDIPQLRAVGSASWRATYTGIFPDEFIENMLEQWWSEANFQRGIPDAALCNLVAEQNGQIIGTLMGTLNPREEGQVYLFRLYIHPKPNPTSNLRAMPSGQQLEATAGLYAVRRSVRKISFLPQPSTLSHPSPAWRGAGGEVIDLRTYLKPRVQSPRYVVGTGFFPSASSQTTALPPSIRFTS